MILNSSSERGHIFAAELILEFDQFVLELYPQLAFVVEVMFEFVLEVPELLPLIFEHELDFPQGCDRPPDLPSL